MGKGTRPGTGPGVQAKFRVKVDRIPVPTIDTEIVLPRWVQELFLNNVSAQKIRISYGPATGTKYVTVEGSTHFPFWLPVGGKKVTAKAMTSAGTLEIIMRG